MSNDKRSVVVIKKRDRQADAELLRRQELSLLTVLVDRHPLKARELVERRYFGEDEGEKQPPGWTG